MESSKFICGNLGEIKRCSYLFSRRRERMHVDPVSSEVDDPDVRDVTASIDVGCVTFPVGKKWLWATAAKQQQESQKIKKRRDKMVTKKRERERPRPQKRTIVWRGALCDSFAVYMRADSAMNNEPSC